MRFLYKESSFNSKKNGVLTYRKFWNKNWFLKISEGEYYSGSYLEKMWFYVLHKYKSQIPKEILILGCGAGCATNCAKSIWPQAHIDALDYDEDIIDAGDIIYPKKDPSKILTIICDAKEFVEKCKKNYDLILIDLFFGKNPSPLLENKDFIYKVEKILNKNGVAVINYTTLLSSKNNEIFKTWSKLIPETTPIFYKSNKLFACTATKIPNSYQSFFQSEAHKESLKNRGLKILENNNSFVLITPLLTNLCAVNAMHTDTEPDILKIKEAGFKHGIIFWTPFRLWNINKNWKKIPFSMHQRGNGFANVKENYKNFWSESARRDLKNFKNSNIYIEESDAKIFTSELSKSNLTFNIKRMQKIMLDKMKNGPIKYFLARDKNYIFGGLAIVNEYPISSHFAAFITKGGTKYAAGTGLIDYWFSYGLSHKYSFLDFGHIKQNGEPKSWNGYSNFKRKFIDQEIIIPKGYFRFF